MAEHCTVRRLSWFVKSCIRDDAEDSLIVTHRRPAASAGAMPQSSAVSPLNSLPDDLLLECIARVPISTLPSLIRVSRRFAAAVDSPVFLTLRRCHGLLQHTLHVLSVSLNDPCPILLSASLSVISPNSKWAELAIPFCFSSDQSVTHEISFSHARVVSLGRFIYLIGRGAMLRYDTWTRAVVSRAPTLYQRKKFAASAIAGKIYVAGGSSHTSAVEEYNPDKDSWSAVAESPRRRYGCVGAGAAGILHIAGGLRVGGGGGEADAGRLEPHVWAGSMDGYDVVSKSWVSSLRSRATGVPGGGCVVGACGVGSHVYVMASHAVEITFWRRGAGGGSEWTRLEPPPVRLSLTSLSGPVRFNCCAAGETRIMALAQVPSSNVAGNNAVMLDYDIVTGAWSRGPALPAGFKRAAVACVEC